MLGRFRLAFCLLSLCSSASAAASVARIITYKGAYTGSQCSVPNNVAYDFAPADQKDHVYVEIDGLKSSDSMGLGWNFGGRQLYTTAFNPVSTDGNYCWADVSLDISQFTSVSSGSWTLQVYVNGQFLLPVAMFTLTVPGGSATNTIPHIDDVNPKFVPAGSGGGSPTISWSQQPPTNFKNGDSFPVAWKVAGGSRAEYSHIHVSSDRNAVQDNPLARIDQQGGNDGSYQDSIAPNSYFTGPLSPGTTIYFMLHASTNAGDVNYWSDLAQTTIQSTTTPPNPTVPAWTCRYDPNLPGLAVVLQKEYLSGTTYQYRVNLMTESGSGFQSPASAFLTVVAKDDPSIRVQRSSTRAKVSYYSSLSQTTDQLLQTLDTAGWQDEGPTLTAQQVAVAKDVLGFINFAHISLLRVPSSSPSVSRRFGDLHGPGIALPCAQRVAQQFLNFLPLPQGQ